MNKFSFLSESRISIVRRISTLVLASRNKLGMLVTGLKNDKKSPNMIRAHKKITRVAGLYPGVWVGSGSGLNFRIENRAFHKIIRIRVICIYMFINFYLDTLQVYRLLQCYIYINIYI